MPYTRNSTLNGTTRVTAGQATSYARSRGARGDYETYIYFLWTWANGRRLNPLVLFGQWCDETATGTSTRWLRGDPAGIGIFADDTPSTLKPNLTGVESAAVHIVELATKAYGVDEPAKIGNVNVLAIDPHLKRVWSFVGRAGWPYPKTLHDLRAPVPGSPGDYVWAANQAYGEQIAAHINRVLSFAGIDEDGMTVSKPSGLTPWPAIVDRPLPDKFGSGMSYQYRKPFVASWWHSMVGWLWSTDAYFRMPSVRAATDYGIGGEGDGASDGVIFRWINYQQREYATPWASGWDTAPHFDDQGAEFFKKFGVRGVNQGGISVEFSGLVATPVSAKQWAAGIHLTAAIHHRDLGQGYEEFAWNMHHREVAEKDCPFPSNLSVHA
jgi:hypothetical protein